MKHIKKRFLFEKQTTPDQTIEDEFLHTFSINDQFDESILSKHKDQMIYFGTESNKLIGGFCHKVSGKNYVVPIPDPTLIYFHSAQIGLTRIEDEKNKLIQKLEIKSGLSEAVIFELYNYFTLTSGFVIYLFTAIESFINKSIPKDYIFNRKLNNRTELYNLSQIQEHIDFKTKITTILTEITGKDFFKKQDAHRIWNLKEFRDQIVHTKKGETEIAYDSLVKRTLNFKYRDTLKTTADFMNYYEKDYIVECGCGKDF